MCSTVPFVTLCNCVLIFWQVSSSFAINCTTSAKPQEQPIPRDAIELVLTKLDHLQTKLETLFELAGQNLTALQEQSNKILAQQAAFTSHEHMRKEIAQLGAEQETNSQGPWTSCKKTPANKSGVYSIQVGDKEELLKVFCEQNSFGGGWLVIQYRFDGSLDFFRDWTEYRNGFGDINREFWIGLEWLHQLTSWRPYELMVEIMDFEGNHRYAHYSAFEIGSESEQYPLKKLGAYNGTAGDSLTYHEGMKFATKDRDNYVSTEDCASTYEGAWWYNACYVSNLNGRYLNKEDLKSMNWYHYKEMNNGLAYSRMMIREINTGA